MTQRRPAHEPVPDFVERQIREAQARGDFDGLRGAGEPLSDLDRPHDELWWVRRKLRDEHVTELPPALRARRDRDRALAAALAAATEEEVRRVVADVNERIRRVNRTTWYGPPTSTGPLDAEAVLARWRRTRPTIQHPVTTGEPTSRGDAPPAPVRRVVRWVAARARRRRTPRPSR